ncbi:MAG TPA: ROK family protein [Glycomyces sp.]|nr:ROK family protein [Glycomyces sp.]
MAELDERNAFSQKRVNAAAVLDQAWDAEAFTAADGMAATRLTRSTVIALCDELVERGWLCELPNARAAGEYRKGRPARRYALRADAGAVVGVDAGQHCITANVADLRGRALARTYTEIDPDGHSGSARVAAADKTIDQALRLAGVPKEAVMCVAAGVPAPTDREGRSPEGEYEFWSRMNPGYAAHFRERGLLTEVENDANLAALAEGALGAGVGASSYITLMSGERFGAGYVVDGRLVRGRRGAAGELRLLSLVEGVGSTFGIGALLREWALELRASGTVDKTSPLMTTPRSRLGAEVVFRAAESGDQAALALIDRMAERLARICAVLGGLLDVERIVFSGAVAESLDLLLPRTAARLDELTHPPAPELVASQLGGGVVSIGAVARALEIVRANAINLSPSTVEQIIPFLYAGLGPAPQAKASHDTPKCHRHLDRDDVRYAVQGRHPGHAAALRRRRRRRAPAGGRRGRDRRHSDDRRPSLGRPDRQAARPVRERVVAPGTGRSTEPRGGHAAHGSTRIPDGDGAAQDHGRAGLI